jgi:hypothetical protein
MRRCLLGLCVLTVLLGGCSTVGSGGSSGPAPVTTPSSPPASTTPSPDVSPAPGPVGALLVEYGRQGGFAGFVDRLVVARDGSYQLTRAKPPVSRHGQLTATELADLRQKLDQADLGHQPRVQASAKGNDLYTYQVSTGGEQVTAQDGSVAPSLQPLLSLLSGLVAKYGGPP